jgi:hypothetical protein
MRHPRARDVGPLVLTCAADAAVVAESIARVHPNTLSVVLLDPDLAVLEALPLRDTDDIEEVATVIYRASAQLTLPNLAVMYITADPPAGVDVTEDAILTWHRVRRHHIHARIPVLDWLLVTGSLVRSMAETTGTSLPW